MTTENNGTTVMDNVKSKLKSINYSILIDKYFTNQNLIIGGGIVLFFILLVTMIRMTSSSSIEIEESRLDKFEKKIDKVYQQQQALQSKINELVDSIHIKKSNSENSAMTPDNIISSKSITQEKNRVFPDLLAENMGENNQNNVKNNSNISVNQLNTQISQQQLFDNETTENIEIQNLQNIVYRSNKEKIFESEMPDVKWKSSAELQIIDALEQTKYSKTWFNNLKCKSSICKLEVSHINKLDSDRFIKDFPLELPEFTGEAIVEKDANGRYISHLFLQDSRIKDKNKIDSESTKESNEQIVKSTQKIKKLRIEDKFKQEKIDNRWRKLIEFKIMTILDDSKFKKTWFDKLLCKTSVCKLVVTHKKRKYSNKFITDFPKTLGEFEKKKALINKNRNGNYKTTMYLQQRI